MLDLKEPSFCDAKILSLETQSNFDKARIYLSELEKAITQLEQIGVTVNYTLDESAFWTAVK